MHLKYKKLLLLLFLILFFSGMLFRYLDRVPKRHYCDFRVYHHTAQVYLSKGDIYVRDKDEVTPFKYSPFFALLASPLGLLPIKTAAALFFTLNFLATIALFALSKKIITNPQIPARQLFLLYFASAIMLSRFILQVWDSGQVNIIMCMLVAAGIYLLGRNKEIAGSACLAASILFKYTPALLLPFLILRKKAKVAAIVLLFLALFLLSPSVYSGLQKNWSYLTSWLPSITGTSLDQASYLDYKNQSLYSMILRFITSTPSAVNFLNLDFRQGLILGQVLAGFLYLLVLIPLKKDTSKIDYALLFTFFALFNPNGWMLNFVSLIFPYMYLVYYLMGSRFKDKFVSGCVILSFMLASGFSLDLIGAKLEFIAARYSFVAFAALLLAAALLRLKFSPKIKYA
jgi:hypothetical protein